MSRDVEAGVAVGAISAGDLVCRTADGAFRRAEVEPLPAMTCPQCGSVHVAFVFPSGMVMGVKYLSRELLGEWGTVGSLECANGHREPLNGGS